MRSSSPIHAGIGRTWFGLGVGVGVATLTLSLTLTLTLTPTLTKAASVEIDDRSRDHKRRRARAASEDELEELLFGTEEEAERRLRRIQERSESGRSEDARAHADAPNGSGLDGKRDEPDDAADALVRVGVRG